MAVLVLSLAQVVVLELHDFEVVIDLFTLVNDRTAASTGDEHDGPHHFREVH